MSFLVASNEPRSASEFPGLSVGFSTGVPIEDMYALAECDYIMGPVSLAAYAPSIPPSTAAFSFSAEGQLAKFGEAGKETTLLIFSYPTPEMARDRYPQFDPSRR